MIRRATLIALLALALAALPAAALPTARASIRAPFVAGELLVRLAPGQEPGTPELAALLAGLGVRSLDPLFPPGETALAAIYKLTLDPERELVNVAAVLVASGLIAYAEPNYLVAAADYTPNDPAYSSTGLPGPGLPDLWGLHTINMGAAWEVTTGSAAVTVAVIDTGLDAGHPELAAALWHNAAETAGNGRDDDGNGYIDDHLGWDFANDDALPADDNGHGTHVAGTIAAAGDNGAGIVGIAWGVRVMALKTLDSNGFGSLELGARAILYATDMGAQVINCSWGAAISSQLLADAVAYAQSRGVIVVAAAGNSSSVVNGFVPAVLPGVLAVAATDPGDGRSSFSNYGSAITVAAPGRNILSLLAAGTEAHCARRVETAYCLRSGTSMAAAHVAGLAALLRSRFPAWPPEAIIEQIKATAVNSDAALGPYAGLMGAGRIDAAAALRPDLGTLAGTVRDAAGVPIAGTLLQAGQFTASADPDGSYVFPLLPTGSYTLTAGRHGYQQQRIAIKVTPDAPLTQDLILMAAEPAWLSGQVSEAGPGWALYARVEASALGDTRVAFSDPLSGAFVLELDAGVSYTVTAQALYPGYQPAAFELTLAIGQTARAIALSPDPVSCAAPGYGLQGGICAPLAGALLVGAITDAEGGAGLPGARLTAGASESIAITTPEDTGQPDGRYALFVPSGSGLLRVMLGGYEPLEVPVSPGLGTLTRRDLALAPLYRPALIAVAGAGWGMGSATVTHRLRLENRGSRPDRFSLSLAMGPGCTGLPWRAALNGLQEALDPGAVAELSVRVVVPAAAPYGASCAVSLGAVSQGDNAARVSHSVTTSAGLRFTSAASEAVPGTSISQTLEVAGWTVGMNDAPVTISVEGERWPISAPAGATLSELTRTGLPLTIVVPLGARAGEQDSAVVHLLTNGGEEVARAGITVTALPVHRPVLVAPDPASAEARPGRRATFSLRLTNGGNIADSYALTLSPDGRIVALPSRLGPLEPGASATFMIVVQLPAGLKEAEPLTVMARSDGDPAQSAQIGLTAMTYAIALPLIACP